MVLVAAGAAFYGASGYPEPPPKPLQSAVPGASCTAGLGAYADHVYQCINGQWSP